MLVLLAVWIALAALACVAGRWALGAAGALELPEIWDRVMVEIWVGVLALASLLLLVSLFMPLKLVVWVVLGAGAACWLKRPFTGFCRGDWAAAVMVLVPAAWLASAPVRLYDTGLYHIQAIAMLREFGTLPGAALLHHRFGFGSSWFALAAAQSVGFERGEMAGAAGGFIFILAVLHFASCLQRVLAGCRETPALFAAVAYPVVFLQILAEGSVLSPSPNAALSLGLVALGWSMLAACPRRAVVLLAGIASLKLTAIPVLVCGSWFLARRGVGRLLWVPVLGTVPLLLSNVVTSGCPLFPGGPCLDAPFSIHREVRLHTAELVHGWARYDGFPPEGRGPADVDWLLPWMLRNKLTLAITGAAGAILLLRRRFPAPALVGAGGWLFVFLTAPDARFLCGFTSLLAGSAASVLRLGRVRQFNVPVAAAALAGGLTVFVYSVIWDHTGPTQPPRLSRLVGPASAPAVPVSPRTMGGVSFVQPHAGDQCWTSAFPCTPYPPKPDTRLCDPALGLGGGICRLLP